MSVIIIYWKFLVVCDSIVLTLTTLIQVSVIYNGKCSFAREVLKYFPLFSQPIIFVETVNLDPDILG